MANGSYMGVVRIKAKHVLRARNASNLLLAGPASGYLCVFTTKVLTANVFEAR